MTIATQISSQTFIGNGATTEFDVSFIMDSAADITVTFVDNTVTPPTTTVLSPSSYTLYINPPAANQIWGIGGTLTYPLSGSPISNLQSLTIARDLPLTQLISLANQGNFYPQVVETGLDTLEMQIQQVANGQGALFVTTSSTSLTIATGLQSFVVANNNLAYAPGQFLIASVNGSPNIYMLGQVISYVGTSLILNVYDIAGSGTYDAWNISVSGPQGAPGNVTSTATVSVDGDIALFSGTSGKVIKDGGNGILNGNLTVNGGISINGGTNPYAGYSLSSNYATGVPDNNTFWRPTSPTTGRYLMNFFASNSSSIDTLISSLEFSAANITAGAEIGALNFSTVFNGVFSEKFFLIDGLTATGLDDQGFGTINATGYFVNNVAISTSNVVEGTNEYFTNARAIASTLTGYTSGAGTISATDSVLTAIEKLNGNVEEIRSGGFGTWDSSSYAVNTVYQASTDGFLVIYDTNTDEAAYQVYTDSANPPTTIRSAKGMIVEAALDYFPCGTTTPIRSGDYFKIVTSLPSYNPANTHIYWLPLGV